MKSLDEVIIVKTQLEKQLLSHPCITGIEISASAGDIRPFNQQYMIRILVNDPGIGFKQLGIPGLYKGVPVRIRYRKTELQ